MATPVSQTLIDAAQCLINCIPPGMVNYVILAQLRLNAGGSVAVPQSLIDATQCELCSIPPGMVPYMILAQLITGGTGGGTVQVYTGAAAPAAPNDPTAPALFYPTGGGTLLQWDVGGAAWV